MGQGMAMGRGSPWNRKTHGARDGRGEVMAMEQEHPWGKDAHGMPVPGPGWGRAGDPLSVATACPLLAAEPAEPGGFWGAVPWVGELPLTLTPWLEVPHPAPTKAGLWPR